MNSERDRPFGELPGALVEEVLDQTKDLSQKLLTDFKQLQALRQQGREKLSQQNMLRRAADLPYPPIPTTCAVDGSYAVERLLISDLAVGAAVAVEGLTPPSETRHWPEPRHQVWVAIEPHRAETSTRLRALVMGMELKLAEQAPHELVFLDGSLTTPLIYFNQALNQTQSSPHLHTTIQFLQSFQETLAAYHTVLTSLRTDRAWIAVPKYTTKREIGQRLGWPSNQDDRAILSFLLEAGEYTAPMPLEQPSEPWHLNLEPLPSEKKPTAEDLAEEIISALGQLQVIYYRPQNAIPALRLEMSRAVAENPARLAIVLQGVNHQCRTPAILEPYPLYMADRMVKHLSKAIPTFRQVISQNMAEAYEGNIHEVFIGLHGYRTESGL